VLVVLEEQQPTVLLMPEVVEDMLDATAPLADPEEAVPVAIKALEPDAAAQ
jgi:hypothetical protein